MPGGVLSISLTPERGRLSHGDLGALHGLLSALLGDSGVQHEATRPLLTLRPQAASAVGWEAFLHTDEAAALLGGWRGERPWRDGTVGLMLGPVRAQTCPTMGTAWETLRVDAVTPVVCHATSATGRVRRDALSAAGVQSSLRGMAGHHYGLHGLAHEMHVEELQHTTESARMHLPRKLHQRGAQLGWLVARFSPAAAWMLRAAAIAGLGARVGYGCGAIRVSSPEVDGLDGEVRWSAGARPQARPEAPGLAGRWFITPHAVEQYRARTGAAPGSSYERALGLCIREAASASYRRRLESGAELWVSPRGVGFIVGAGEGAKPAVITVLGPGARA